MDYKSFHLMTKYLLFCSTYAPIPVDSVIDTKIKENLEKGGTAKNISFWNWTPEQRDLLNSNIYRVILTSYWSTGKTRLMFEKAKMLAEEGKSVIFVLDRGGKSTPFFLYHTLTNEINSLEIGAKLKLMMCDGLQDVLKKVKGVIF